MKHVILVPDGMADYPIESLDNKTPLEAANTPNMDAVVKRGVLGLVHTIPAGMTPASDVANMSILGYDPLQYYSGRGPLEAANMNIKLADDEVAFRCNLVTEGNGLMVDYSAGHISNKETEAIIRDLNKFFKADGMRFYAGVSYRNLFVIKDNGRNLAALKCVAPHDILNQGIAKHLPRGKNADVIIDLINRSHEFLSNHEINKVRLDLGENPANMIWLWGQGKRPSMPTYKERFNKTGAVISAVDLIKGIGKIAGLDVLTVPGATAYYDTDYQAKADYGIRALRNKDFVFVHVEAPDEAGHNGDLREKILAIERFDSHIVGSFLRHFEKIKEPFRMLVLPDHATPVTVRTHTSDKVCFAMCGEGVAHNGFEAMGEQKAKESNLFFPAGVALIEQFFKEGTL